MNKKLLILIGILSFLILLVKGFGWMKDYRTDKRFQQISYYMQEDIPNNRGLYLQLDSSLTDVSQKEKLRAFQLQADQLVRLIDVKLEQVKTFEDKGKKASDHFLQAGVPQELKKDLDQLNQSAAKLMQNKKFRGISPDRYLTQQETQEKQNWSESLFESMPNSVVTAWLIRFKHDVRKAEKYMLEQVSE